MGTSCRLYVICLLLSVTAASLGCRVSGSATAVMPATAQPVTLTVEPEALAPDFSVGSACHGHPPFDLRFVVRLGGPAEVFFQRMRFRFEDRTGRVEIPRISLGAGPAILPGSSLGQAPFAVGLPNASPIPIPSATTLPGMVLSFGSARQLPLKLQFGCGVPPSGTLIVIVDFDDRGHSLSSETRVIVR